MSKAKLRLKRAYPKPNQYILDKGVLLNADVTAKVVVDCMEKAGVIPTTSKATGPNPKDVVGRTKASMLLFPPIALVHAVDAMMDGAGKYDPYNWRAKHITTSNYLHAAIRHIIDYWEGQECAPDSLAKHLGHAIATLAIVLDAQAHGCLIDDRPASDGGVAVAKALEQVMKNEAFRKERRERARGQDGALRYLASIESARQQSKKRNKVGTQKVKKK